jgi:hypothetical protein
MMPWPNLRVERAKRLSYEIMRTLDGYLPDRLRREVHNELLKLLSMEGVEIVTDDERTAAGLPPRDARGYTPDELVALEQSRLNALNRPLTIMVPGDGPGIARSGDVGRAGPFGIGGPK